MEEQSSTKNPFVRIFANDTLASLMSLSLAGCGAWFKIVLILSQAQNRGVETKSKQAWARILGATAEQADRVFDELKAEQAFDFEENGSSLKITSRYMVRETAELNQNRLRQQRFREKKKSVTQKKRECNANVTPQNTEYRIQKKEEKEKGHSPDLIFDFLDEKFSTSSEFRRVWQDWTAYRRERKLKAWESSTIERKAKEFNAWGVQETIASIEASISNGWQGIFPDKGAKPKGADLDIKTFKTAYRFLNEGTLSLDISDFKEHCLKVLSVNSIEEIKEQYPSEYEDILKRLKEPFSPLKKRVEAFLKKQN